MVDEVVSDMEEVKDVEPLIVKVVEKPVPKKEDDGEDDTEYLEFKVEDKEIDEIDIE